MKSSKPSTLILVALGAFGSLAGATMAWHSAAATHEAQLEIAAAAAARAAAENASRGLEEKIAASMAERAALENERAQLAATRLKSKAALNGRIMEKTSASQAGSPEMEARIMKTLRSNLSIDYFPLYRELSLTADQIGRFENILMQNEGRKRDLIFTIENQRMSYNDPIAAALRSEAEKLFKADLRSVIGLEGEQRFDEYKRFFPNERRLIGQFVGNLVTTATPLTPAQVQQFTTLVKEQNLPSQHVYESTLWDTILARAEGFLDEPQLTELRAFAALKQGERAAAELSRLLLSQEAK